MRGFIFVLALVFAGTSAAELPVLNVYTYDSFSSKWGPGPRIKVAFEKRCACELNFVSVDSSTGLLARILLEGESSRADVVLGLDNNLLADAKKTGLLAPHGMTVGDLDLPFAWDDATFLPFDYGYFAFVYNREKLPKPPASFAELVADETVKIIIQDPRSSTPGLGLLLWVKAIYGDGAAAVWRKLADKIVTVTRSWSEAYGLFLDGEAELVLSYTTSPAYHATVEDDRRFAAAAFAEGHGVQIEVAAQLAAAPNPALAQAFMAFIISEEFQAAIPTGNWMYPVKTPRAGLPAAFAELVQPAAVLLLDAETVAANRAAWVDEFGRALRR